MLYWTPDIRLLSLFYTRDSPPRFWLTLGGPQGMRGFTPKRDVSQGDKMSVCICRTKKNLEKAMWGIKKTSAWALSQPFLYGNADSWWVIMQWPVETLPLFRDNVFALTEKGSDKSKGIWISMRGCFLSISYWLKSGSALSVKYQSKKDYNWGTQHFMHEACYSP